MIQNKIFFDEKDPTGVSYSTPFTVYGSYQGRLWSKTPSGEIKYYTQNSDLSVYATTGSNSFNGNQTVTGSLTVTGDITGDGINVFATTGSNSFTGSQAISGSLIVSGEVVAQTLNVQQVTSSVVYSSGSNVFGNNLGNTQQLIGSVDITGSLDVIGTGTFTDALNGTSANFSGVVSTLSSTTNGFVSQTNANSVHPYFRWIANNRSYWAAAIDNGSDATFKIGGGNTIGSSPFFTVDSGTNTSSFTTTLAVTGGALTVRNDQGTGVDAQLRLRGTNSTARTTRLQFEDYNGTLADGLIDFKIGTAGVASSATLSIGINSPNLTFVSTGAATFSSSVTATQYTATSTGGSGLRVYGASGTNQWDIYLNGANIRFSDNTGGGNIVFDRPLNGTSAVFTSGIEIGDYTQSTNTLTFAALNNGIAKINFYDANQTEGLYIRTDGDVYGGTMTFGARWDDDEAKIAFKMYQASAGATYNARVGIGTSSPSTDLHINAPNAILRVQSTSATDDTKLQIWSNNYYFDIINEGGDGHIKYISDNEQDQIFYTDTQGASVERFRIGSRATAGLTETSFSNSYVNIKQPSYSSSQTPLYVGNTQFGYNRQSYDTFVLQQDDVTSLRMVERNPSSSDQVLTFSIGDNLGVIATSAQPLGFYVNGSPTGLAYQGLSGTQVLRLNTDGTATFYGSVSATNFSGGTYPYNSNFGSGADASTGTLYAGSTAGYSSSIAVAGGGATNPGTIIFKTATEERMRITSGGAVLFGTDSAALSSGAGFKYVHSATIPYFGVVVDSPGATSLSNFHHYNVNATYNGFRFYITNNGGIYNYSANNVNLSDERVKTNIELSGNYLDKICSIPVRLFNYKDEPEGTEKNLGVIAQEVEAFAPELVNSEGFGETPEDGIPLKSVYTTDMMYALMKAIQELKSENDNLKLRLEVLEQA